MVKRVEAMNESVSGRMEGVEVTLDKRIDDVKDLPNRRIDEHALGLTRSTRFI
jgi:hypothetical protein